MVRSNLQSATWTFFEEEWHEGNVGLMGPRTHAAWLGSSVFDGARTFEGVGPDVDLHFQRVNESAKRLLLQPRISLPNWIDLAKEGIRKFSSRADLYLRPMYWAEGNGPLAIAPNPETTRWCLTIYESPLPEPTGFSITLSPFRRPAPDTMPVDAKAGCLYPNNARAIMEAYRRGFDNCVMCDMSGNVAELANSNIFAVKNNIVYTPAINGSFLNGITRQRTIKLLRDAGVIVVESILHYHDLIMADEVFSSGNYAILMPVTRIDERSISIGPLYRKARELYWAFAHSSASLAVRS